MKPGFTFVELVVGLGVATVLSAVVIPTVARSGVDKPSAMREVKSALRSNDLYNSDHDFARPTTFCCEGRYPTLLDPFSANVPCVADLGNGGYMCVHAPIDPSGCSNPEPPPQPNCHPPSR